MNCPDALDLLQRSLDGEAVGDRAALDAHLAGCTECRERHAAARRLGVGLRRLAAPAPPPGLAEHIVVCIVADRQARFRMRRRFFAIGAVAAGLLLLLTVRLSVPGGDGQPGAVPRLYDRIMSYLWPTPPTVVVIVDPSGSMTVEDDLPPGPPEELPPPSLRDAVADAGSAVIGLTQRAANDTVGQGRILVPDPMLVGPLPQPEAAAPATEPAAKSLREARDGAASGLEPVASSARRAFGLFLREIPMAEPAPEPDTEE